MLTLTIAVNYAAAAKRNASAWMTLLQDGVYGASASAPWIGIDEYFRREKPANVSVLPMYWLKPGAVLRIDRAFGTRSGGHPMPIPEFFQDFMNPDDWRYVEEQENFLAAIGADFAAGAAAAAVVKIEKLALVPDYLILPVELTAQRPELTAPYVEETRMNGFAILRRSAESGL